MTDDLEGPFSNRFGTVPGQNYRRCAATTKRGNRCRAGAREGRDTCPQHDGWHAPEAAPCGLPPFGRVRDTFQTADPESAPRTSQSITGSDKFTMDTLLAAVDRLKEFDASEPEMMVPPYEVVSVPNYTPEQQAQRTRILGWIAEEEARHRRMVEPLYRQLAEITAIASATLLLVPRIAPMIPTSVRLAGDA